MDSDAWLHAIGRTERLPLARLYHLWKNHIATLDLSSGLLKNYSPSTHGTPTIGIYALCSLYIRFEEYKQFLPLNLLNQSISIFIA